ncbi:MAG: hypothetical protein V2G48_02485 [bacterium JZ-2024 1]
MKKKGGSGEYIPVDRLGRVLIPKEIRVGLDEEMLILWRNPVFLEPFPSICFCNHSLFRQIVSEAEAWKEKDPQVYRALVTSLEELHRRHLDELGRLLLPRTLLEYARIQRWVKIVGFRVLRIYSRESYEERQKWIAQLGEKADKEAIALFFARL